jgi:ABC-type amino acid transport substrate-binding protein
LTLLTISASGGYLQFRKRIFTKAMLVISITTLVSVFALRSVLSASMKGIPSNLEIINNFKLISTEQDFVVFENSRPNPNQKWRGENSLSRIKRRGKIRIGFYEHAAPFSFRNKDTLLVGFGIDLAHQLAGDLEVAIEFIHIRPGELIQSMNSDHIDIMMSDIFLSSQLAEQVELSKPYLNVSLALLTKKENKDFDDFDTATKLDTFTISYIDRLEIAKEFLSYFPKGGSFAVPEINDYFELSKDLKKEKDSSSNDSIVIDAHLTSAERAASVTIYKTGYKVVNPLPYHINNALVFPIARDEVWRGYINKWVDFRKQDGTFDKIYTQWILGHPNQKKVKKWNVLDDVIKARFFKEKDSIDLSEY